MKRKIKWCALVLFVLSAVLSADWGTVPGFFGPNECWCNDHRTAGNFCIDICGGYRECLTIEYLFSYCSNDDLQCITRYHLVCRDKDWDLDYDFPELCPEDCKPQT